MVGRSWSNSDEEDDETTKVEMCLMAQASNESLNVTFDESPPPPKTSPLVDDEFGEEEAIKNHKKIDLENDIELLEDGEIINMKEFKIHPLEKVIGTRTEHGFERAFISLFAQDVETFTSTMFLYVDQLEKQLDKDEFQEDGSMAAFRVLNRQCQQFIYSQLSLDYDSEMTNKYFSEYTRIEAKEFRDTLLKLMSSVKKLIVKRTLIRDSMTEG
ncbi:hypothetical protein Tco_1088242 [Tanacetum coccineum]